MKLNALLDEQTRRDAELVAVAIDNRALLQKMANKLIDRGAKADFTFLSDSAHRVIDRYGLLNEASVGWPHPTTYVIDRQGVVRWKFTEVNYKIRPTNQKVMDALAKLDGDKR